MPLRMVSVEKEGSFQGRTERWSNVYCYDMDTANATTHEGLADAVVAAERPVHTSSVAFKTVRVFTTQGLNTLDPGSMYLVKALNVSGTGTNTGTGTWYRELAYLVKWPLPRKTLAGNAIGRERSLKKWIHSFGHLAAASSELEGQQALGSTAKAPFLTYAAAITIANGEQLCSPGDGAYPTVNGIVHPYIEHRQFPKGRKEDT